MLLFTPFSATRFAMHRIYASRINSRGMSRVFCDLRSPKTPRGILPVNSNVKFICYSSVFFSFKHICFLSQRYLKKSLISTKLTFQQQSAAVLLLILMTVFHGIPHTRMQWSQGYSIYQWELPHCPDYSSEIRIDILNSNLSQNRGKTCKNSGTNCIKQPHIIFPSQKPSFSSVS